MEDTSPHNSPFSMKAMQEALKTYFRNRWKQVSFPEEWRTALTIPIQKPGKDPENPGSYLPISLTSCL
jgi:hypothetical protein